MHATHVVVDELDGYTFVADSDGQLFDYEAATEFARVRNSERKEFAQTFTVYALTPVVPEGRPVCVNRITL